MSTKLKHQEKGGETGNVVSLNKCISQGCGKKADLLTFCHEHYDWYKFGLITKKGERPTDFDKKYIAYQRHHKKAV
jgi:hypothetical protein